MIQSMTGFGKSEVNLSHKNIRIQLKSLNSRKFDLYARIPHAYMEKELILQKLISEHLNRGKIEFTLVVENLIENTAVSIDKSLIQKYMQELKAISPYSSENEHLYLKMALGLPNTVKTKEEEVDEQEFEAVLKGVKEALKDLNQYRSDEGKSIEKDFRLCVKNIQELVKQVEEKDRDRIVEKRQKLKDALADLKEEADPNRFEQELIYYLEKYDINEEISRLRTHLNYFIETLDQPQSEGRKLGFISQEMGREINTIGSKSNSATLQKIVVQMKDELDKIKEQILNVL